MTLDAWTPTVVGKYLNYDGAFGAQCVDLISFYCRDVVEVPAGTGNAINWTPRGGFIKHGKTTPQKGDVIVYGSSYGTFGHISISLGGMGVLEQNGFRGANTSSYNAPGDQTRITNRTLDGVINVYRPINQGGNMSVESELRQQIRDMQAQIDIMRPALTTAVNQNDGLRKELDNARKAFDGFVMAMQTIADLVGVPHGANDVDTNKVIEAVKALKNAPVGDFVKVGEVDGKEIFRRK